MTDATDVPHIVKEFTVGKTRIRIADNFCRDKTPNDVSMILREIASMTRDAVVASSKSHVQTGR